LVLAKAYLDACICGPTATLVRVQFIVERFHVLSMQRVRYAPSISMMVGEDGMFGRDKVVVRYPSEAGTPWAKKVDSFKSPQADIYASPRFARLM
jgi:hypothetical protein